MPTTNDTTATLATLSQKLAAARERKTASEALIAAGAFAANTGDAGAQKKQAKLIGDIGSLNIDIASLESAVAEAKRRVDAAVAADADAAEVERAKQALEILDRFAARGAALDRAFDSAIGEYNALAKELRELERLGFPATTPALVASNMRAAATTKLQFSDLRVAFLAPNERRNFVSAIESWALIVRARATARLQRGKPGEVAA